MARKVYCNKDDFLIDNDKLKKPLPYSDEIEILGSSLKIGNKTINNRLVCQAMEGCDGKANGEPGELTIRRYMRLVEGGAGMIWFEATACQEDGRANPRQLWLTNNNLDSFKRLVYDIKSKGIQKNGYEPIIVMQDTHSGRYSKPNGYPAPLIAYNNPTFEKDTPISKDRILSDESIDKIQENLIQGAKLAEKAGFDGVDIKCCHRYLNSELLSAYTREGKYGGSLENRTRLLRETVNGAISACSENFIVTSRLNVYDGFEYPYGFGVKEGSLDFDKTEPLWLLNELKKSGIKLVNITMGNPYVNPHVNRPFAMGGYTPEEEPLEGVARMLNGISDLKKELPEMKVISSGISYLGTVSPNVCAAFIKDGGFDFCGYGRMIFAYPDFANDILKKGALDDKKICICCSKCTEIMRAGSTPGCVIRDKEIYAELYKKYCIKKG